MKSDLISGAIVGAFLTSDYGPASLKTIVREAIDAAVKLEQNNYTYPVINNPVYPIFSNNFFPKTSPDWKQLHFEATNRAIQRLNKRMGFVV